MYEPGFKRSAYRALEPLSNTAVAGALFGLEITQPERSIKYEKLPRYTGSIPSW